MFLDKAGIRPRMRCLDVGCGGGDVLRDLAKRVGANGQVVGIDMDAAQLAIVRAEAAAQNLHNIDYRVADVVNPPSDLWNLRSRLHPLPFEPFKQAGRGSVLDVEVLEVGRPFGHLRLRLERPFLLSATASI
jgi:SAM-dependent methyltransferase